MLTTTCKGCGLEITGRDEDDLVTEVQAHIGQAHSRGHTPTREQVLAVIRTRTDKTS